MIIFYLLQQVLNKQLTKLILNLNINGDVEAVCTTVKNIYENNYFFSLMWPKVGYGQLIPHIQASTYKALFNIEVYNFALPTSRLFLL